MKRFAVTTLCAFALLFAACESEQEEAMEETPAMQADIDAYRTDVTVRTQRIDTMIAELEAKAANADEEMREEYNEMLAELRDERQELAADLDALEAETEEELMEAKMEMDEELDELEHDIDEAQLAFAANVEEFRMAADRQLAEIDADIDRLQNEAGAEAEEAIEDLEQQRQELAADLDALGDAAEEEFHEMKMGVIEGFRALGDAIGDIRVPVDVDVETAPIDAD